MAEHERRIKCEGRFPEMRECLGNEVLPLVLGDEITVGPQQLEQAWELIQDDTFKFDLMDSYFDNYRDPLRKSPEKNHLSLVPLIEGPYHVSNELVNAYLAQMGNNSAISNLTTKLNEQPSRFLLNTLEREPRTIVFPESGGKSLAGYSISGNFGIGTVAPGGISGGGIRSDSPFLLEVNQLYNDKARRGEKDLVALIGFWAQDNAMLVSQMQPCKNAHFPEGVKFGVGALHIAEVIAREIGYEKIMVYNARSHPLFKAYPENWGQLAQDFVCMWDNSAKKLGFDGSRNEHHEKDLRSH